MAPAPRALLVILPSIVHAASTFSSQCTLPEHSVNYVSGPDTRGTLSILWTCLFTIVACTWTVLHLNVPEQREDRDRFPNGPWHKQLRGDLKWMLKRFWSTFKWMIVTVLAPEVTLGESLEQLLDARALCKRFRNLGDDVWEQWTLTHIIFAEMGGFILREDSDTKDDVTNTPLAPEASRSCDEERYGSRPLTPVIDNQYRPEVSEEPGLSDVQQLDTAIRLEILQRTSSRQSEPERVELLPPGKRSRTRDGVSESVSSRDNERQSSVKRGFPKETRDYCNPYHLRGETVLKAIEQGLIPRKPPITEDEINDKAKSDIFGKTIAIAQISWFCINVIARGARGLNVSQLEVAVTAFSACSVVMYSLNFKKPKSVTIATTLKISSGRTIKDIVEVQRAVASARWKPDALDFDRTVIGSYVSNLAEGISDAGFYGIAGAIYGLAGASVLFGSIHLIAWNFEFPTVVDRDLWRSAAMISTFVLPLMFIFASLNNWFNSGTTLHDFVEATVAITTIVLYVPARLILIVEMFRCLAYLPPDAYVTTWTSNIPHVG